ncbi:4Fe-4S dicluster domain-containing protein [Desulfococcaceae bacterium HSG8]|nr:4Fe-4S dicluster domain-containing protein [Desulfococcaceae bacterium HSG8]
MIEIDPSVCSGCSRCEVNCTFFHTGKVGRSMSRIKVVKIEEKGIDFPVVCRQCRERYCTRCPSSAITLGKLGQVIVSATLCDSCGVCESLCPVGAIELHEGLPYVCDLCGGTPNCVKECSMGAIRFEKEVSDHVSLSEFKKKSAKLSPESKRFIYVEETTQALRNEWASRNMP